MTAVTKSNYRDLLFEGTEPQYEQVGMFRMRRHDDLLVAEAAELEQVDRDRMQAMVHVLSIAKRCAQDNKIPLTEAMELIQQGTRDPNKSALVEAYIDEMALASVGQPLQVMTEARVVTMFIRSRGEILRQKKWQALEDWQQDDTLRMPNKLRAKLVEFVNNEREGWPQAGKNEEATATTIQT
jgi:hypothetical protein